MSAKGQVVIVTGGHKGIGKEIVRGLVAADKRAKCYIASRNLQKARETREELMAENCDAIIEIFKCDLGDFDSIEKFVKHFQREEKKLHILICNAEVMWGPRRVTKHGIELQLGINHVGHFYLANLLVDHLQATDNRVRTSLSNKVIVITSVAHMVGEINFEDLNSEKSYTATLAYAQSKLANILWAKELAKRIEEIAVVNAVNPGIVAKGLTQQKGWHGYKTAVEGAALPLKLCLDPYYAYATGQFYGDHNDCLTIIRHNKYRDKKAAEKLWTATEALIKSHEEYIPVEVVPPPPSIALPEVSESKEVTKGIDLEMIKDPQALVGWFSSKAPK